MISKSHLTTNCPACQSPSIIDIAFFGGSGSASMAFMIRSELPPLIADCRLSSSAPAFLDTWVGRVTNFISIFRQPLEWTNNGAASLVKAPYHPCCTLFAAKPSREDGGLPRCHMSKKKHGKTTFSRYYPFPASPTPKKSTDLSNIGF